MVEKFEVQSQQDLELKKEFTMEIAKDEAERILHYFSVAEFESQVSLDDIEFIEKICANYPTLDRPDFDEIRKRNLW